MQDLIKSVQSVLKEPLHEDAVAYVRAGRFNQKESTDETIDEAVEIKYDRYVRVHGKKPKVTGRAPFMFTSKATGGVSYNDKSEVLMVPSTTADDAKKQAKAWGKKHGHSAVYFMESLDKVVEEVAGLNENKVTIRESVLSKLEKDFGKIKPGRNSLGGLPVDIDDQNPEEDGLVVEPVDRDALNDLKSVLRRKGYKVKVVKNKYLNIKEDHAGLNENFTRVPKKIIGNDLFTAKTNLDTVFDWLRNGNDYNTLTRNTVRDIIKSLQTLDRSAKTFGNVDDVPTEFMSESVQIKNNTTTTDFVKVLRSIAKDDLDARVFLTKLADRIEQSHPQRVSHSDILKLKREPAFRNLWDDNTLDFVLISSGFNK